MRRLECVVEVMLHCNIWSCLSTQLVDQILKNSVSNPQLTVTLSLTKTSQSMLPACLHLTTGPLPLPNRVLNRLLSSTSAFNIQPTLFSLSSSICCLRLLPHLPVLRLFYPSLYLSFNIMLHVCDEINNC
jgi:hypothetical protein